MGDMGVEAAEAVIQSLSHHQCRTTVFTQVEGSTAADLHPYTSLQGQARMGCLESYAMDRIRRAQSAHYLNLARTRPIYIQAVQQRFPTSHHHHAVNRQYQTRVRHALHYCYQAKSLAVVRPQYLTRLLTPINLCRLPLRAYSRPPSLLTILAKHPTAHVLSVPSPR